MQLSAQKLPYEPLYLPPTSNDFITYLMVAGTDMFLWSSFRLRPPCHSYVSLAFSSSTADTSCSSTFPQKALVFESWSWPSTQSPLPASWGRAQLTERSVKAFLGLFSEGRSTEFERQEVFSSSACFWTFLSLLYCSVFIWVGTSFTHEKELLSKFWNTF